MNQPSGRATFPYNLPRHFVSAIVADSKIGRLFSPFETANGAIPGIGRAMVLLHSFSHVIQGYVYTRRNRS